MLESTMHIVNAGKVYSAPYANHAGSETCPHHTVASWRPSVAIQRNSNLGRKLSAGTGSLAAAPARGRSMRRSHRLRVSNIGWDPEGLLAPPPSPGTTGHIARRVRERKALEEEASQEDLEREQRRERERRQAKREARVVPSDSVALMEFFLDTEVPDMDFEIARCRKLLTDEFFDALRGEMGTIRFSTVQSEESQNRLAELEALEQVLKDGVEAYDRLTSNIVRRKDILQEIFTSRDKKATLLELSGKQLLDRPLLSLLDENIAAARAADEAQVVTFMESIRGAVLKYITI
eukprot:TRINITY_DN17154_c0_g1_i2.p1 TRINITY_DN17154_c0_g1~~TRINITY_DN17154_c0_g1_i2.p1  ORF type:complete len:292 (-),score=69.88 TRINITY_DN17154_c0_g1_i2:259-1134(-)